MKVIISLSKVLLLFLMFDSYFTSPAKAQCVQGDVSVQYSISGSEKPSQRTNDVIMESDPKCRGNSSITTGVQGHIGPNNAEQNRQVHQVQQGNNKYPQVPNGTTVQIRSNVQVDVDNPVDRFPHHRKK